jgi:hypothetical protein
MVTHHAKAERSAAPESVGPWTIDVTVQGSENLDHLDRL